MMPDLYTKIIKLLIEKYELSTNELSRELPYPNKNRLIKYLKHWETKGLLHYRQDGNKILYSLKSPDKKINLFLKNYGKQLLNYEKLVKKHLSALEKNKPLINPEHPFNPIKTKVPILELDKKRQVYRAMGNTNDGHGFIWKIRPKPLFHFNAILQILNNIYQESSILTFGTLLCDDPILMKLHQKSSQRLIEQTVKEIQDMFTIEKTKDGKFYKGTTDYVYVINRLRDTLYGFVHKATIEKQFEDIKKSASKVS